MAKYKMKETIIEVVPYKFGHESGIINGTTYINADHRHPACTAYDTKFYRYDEKHEKYLIDFLENRNTNWKPYITNSQGNYIAFSKDDMIILENGYKKCSISKEILANDYILLDDNNELDVLKLRIYELEYENTRLENEARRQSSMRRGLSSIQNIAIVLSEKYPDIVDDVIEESKTLGNKLNDEFMERFNKRGKNNG